MGFRHSENGQVTLLAKALRQCRNFEPLAVFIDGHFVSAKDPHHFQQIAVIEESLVGKRGVTEKGEDKFALGHEFPVFAGGDRRHGPAVADRIDGRRINQGFSRSSFGLVEDDFRDLGQDDFMLVIESFADEQPGGLRESLDNQGGRHHRVILEMVVQMVLGQGDRFDRFGILATAEDGDSVDPIPVHVIQA